jgi:hypothetical protein
MFVQTYAYIAEFVVTDNLLHAVIGCVAACFVLSTTFGIIQLLRLVNKRVLCDAWKTILDGN